MERKGSRSVRHAGTMLSIGFPLALIVLSVIGFTDVDSSPILSEGCSKLKYIIADAATNDNTCVEEGIFAIPQNCHAYYRCDSNLRDFYMDCETGENFNGTHCDRIAGSGNSSECLQKHCFVLGNSETNDTGLKPSSNSSALGSSIESDSNSTTFDPTNEITTIEPEVSNGNSTKATTRRPKSEQITNSASWKSSTHLIPLSVIFSSLNLFSARF